MSDCEKVSLVVGAAALFAGLVWFVFSVFDDVDLFIAKEKVKRERKKREIEDTMGWTWDGAPLSKHEQQMEIIRQVRLEIEGIKAQLCAKTTKRK